MKRASHYIAVAITALSSLANAATLTPIAIPDTPLWASSLSADGSSVIGLVGFETRDGFYWNRTTGMTLIPHRAGDWASTARAISSDGSFLVGITHYVDLSTGANSDRGFRWSPSTGLVPLPESLGQAVENAISFDGNATIGSTLTYDSINAFRWTQSDGFVPFEQGIWHSTYATSLSHDGGVLGGWANTSDSGEGFRWSAAGGLALLGYLSSSDTSSAVTAMSADGSVLTGVSGADNLRASSKSFRWTQAGGMQAISDRTTVYADFISDDGSVIVGTTGEQPEQPFRWTAATGLVDLGLLEPTHPVAHTVPNAMSADGSIIVGNAATTAGDSGWIWTEQGGLRSMQQFLSQEMGLDLTGWEIKEATSISADGLTLLGDGTHNGQYQVWVAAIPEPAILLLLTTTMSFTCMRRSNKKSSLT